MKVLIIGSTGFIGKRVVEFCLREGWDVVAGARRPEKARETFRDLPVDIVKVDVSSEGFYIRCDAVVNLAALLPKKCDDVVKMFDVNAIGVYRLMRKCKQAGVQKIVHSSSMAVFGKVVYLPVDEAHPKHPTTYYGASKLAGELIMENEEWKGIERVLLRYSSVYGPGMDKSEVIPVFIRKMLSGETVHAVKGVTADFVFVDDVARANVLALKYEMEKEFEDFNIGSGKEIAIEELAEIVKKVTASKSRIGAIKGRDRRFYFDISKAREKLKYEPEISLERGLKICVGSFEGGG